LPLQGIRTFDALALLLPGVAPAPQTLSSTTGPGIGSSVGTAGQFSVNGLRSRGNNFTIDGSDNNDEDIGVRRQGYTSLVPQSIESVRQFQISTLLPEPQFGRNMGAQANVVSRSGGAGFHGTAYGFLTDQRLNARDFFDLDSKNLPAKFPVLTSGKDSKKVILDTKPLEENNPVGAENPFTRSQAGFVFGGPIVKEKTHLFMSFEHQDINASKESHFAVPTVSQRGLFDSGGSGLTTIINRGGIPVKDYFYPTSTYGDSVYSLYPFPNNPLGPFGDNTRTEILPSNADGLILSLKLDHHFGVKHILSGRYNISDDNTILPVTGEALFSSFRSRIRTQNFSLFFDSAISGRASNQLRISYGRTSLGFHDLPNGLAGERSISFTDQNDKKFLLNGLLFYNYTDSRYGEPPDAFYRSYADLSRRGSGGLPVVNGTEAVTKPIGQVFMSGFSSLGIDVFNFPQERTNNTFQYADTLFYNFAKIHRITAGFDVRRGQLNSFLDRNSRSQLVFSGAPNLNQVNSVANDIFLLGGQTEADQSLIFRELIYRGSDFAAVGAPTGFSQSLVGPNGFGTIGLRYWQSDFFFADQMRIQPGFSLTLGLRYSMNTVPTEVKHRIEDSFQSEEVKAFIALEKQENRNAGRPAVSGLEQFLDNRTSIFREDHNNLAPYLTFAWDPFGLGKTSIRAGYGIYYDQIPGAVISQSRNVFPNFLTLNLGGYRSYPVDSGDDFLFTPFNPFNFAKRGSLNSYDPKKGGQDLVSFMFDTAKRTNNASGPAFVLPSNNLRSPYAQHWAVNFEQEIRSKFLISLAYVGTQANHLLRFATPNLGPNAIPVVLQVVPVPGTIVPQFRGTTVSPGKLSQTSETRLQTDGRPFPLLGPYTSIESDARSFYNSLQLQMNKRFSHGLQFTTAYSWSHAIDEVSDLFDLAGTRSLPQNSFDLRAERGNASFDVRHRFVTSFIWDLPVLRHGKLLGGWQVSGIGTIQTGFPFTISAPYDVNLDGNLTDRLNGTVGFKEVRENEVLFKITDPLTQLAELGKEGAVSRNTFRAPGIATVDLATSKRFRFTESQNLELRAEFFNLFNRTHFGIPVRQVDFPGFGRSVSTTIPARMIQFALKYSF
jgi:hypothetical protein